MKAPLTHVALCLLAACAPPVDPDQDWWRGLDPLPDRPSFEPDVQDLDAARALGRALFHDRRLSESGQRACVDCHDPARAFSGHVSARLEGFGLDAPSLLGVAHRAPLGWRGRFDELQSAALHPFGDPRGFGEGIGALREVFAGDAGLRGRYEAVLGEPTRGEGADLLDGVGRLLSAYLATLEAGDSALDRAIGSRSIDALSADVRRGWIVFRDEGCVRCHPAPEFTDGQLRWHGLPDLTRATGPLGEDPLTELESVQRERRPEPVRTPSLRDVTSTGPYMHDGRYSSLDEVLDFYAQGARESDGVEPVELTSRERADLIAFLDALRSGRAPLAELGAPVAMQRPAADRPQSARKGEVEGPERRRPEPAPESAPGERLALTPKQRELLKGLPPDQQQRLLERLRDGAPAEDLPAPAPSEPPPRRQRGERGG